MLMSYSAARAFKTCPQLYDFKYRQRVKPKEEGSSLAFGIAVDISLGYLLNCKKDGKEEIGIESFRDFFLTDKNKGWNNAFDNPKYRYRKADFDANVVSSVDDATLIKKWETELKVKKEAAIKAEKQKDFKPFGGNYLKLFNRLCWLSLKRKGQLMLDAFLKDVYPNIIRVIAVQQKLEGEVGEVADAAGYIDLICEYKEYDKPVVLDIKTSASFYDKTAVEFSEQLHLYLAAVSEELQTDYAGYIVLLKFMNRKDVCTSCGNIKNSKHRTCNAEVDGKRCGAKWKGIPEGHTQVMIEKVSKEKQEEAIRGFTNLTILASQGIIYKDYDRCFDYGLCDMFYLCHYGDKSKYVIPEKKESLKTLPVLNNTPKEEVNES